MADEIPEDLRNIANSIAWDLPSRVLRLNREFASNVIARALLAERAAENERCAKIAEANLNHGPLDAATSIRTPSHD